MEIDFGAIEKKWQGRWAAGKTFEVDENSGKEPFYVLEMFPYPSGAGLHMGHALNYTIGDILARFKRMKGFEVLHPMGFDALGLPAENAAIKAGTHPAEYTDKAIENYIRQAKALGISYDWSRMVNTTSPDYYKWDQWIFLKMLEKGLAYQKEASVNWCGECNTVLANEQVNEGKCWRHEDVEVEVRKLKQWFFKTTEYADELLEGLKGIDWPERTKKMQENWIGRSEGTEIEFSVENSGTADGGRRTADDLGNVVIVHGGNDNEEEAKEGEAENIRHWQPWIREKLEAKGVDVSAKLYPEDWNPNYKKWKKEFEGNDINENSILVGHSDGGCFLVRWLGETKRKVRKLILVVPWKIGSDGRAEGFYDYDIDEGIKDRVGEIVMFISDSERGHQVESFNMFHEALGGKVIDLKGKEHFVLGDMGTREFPELLREIVGEGNVGTLMDADGRGFTKGKKPTILLVHGIGKDGNESWLRWFREKYRNDYNIIAPDFPNSSEPKLNEWLSEMEKHKDDLNEESILIGQSLGCPTVCKFLEKNKIKVKKVILVAPGPAGYDKKDFDIIKGLIPKGNFTAVKKYTEDLDLDFSEVKKYADDFVLFFSKDDPYVFDYNERLKSYSGLGAEVVLFEDKSHFNESAGILELPEIDEYVGMKNKPRTLADSRGHDEENVWRVFTTRPDTIFGVTFMVVAAGHDRLGELVTDSQEEEVERFLKKVRSVSEKDSAKLDKEGVFTGSYMVNPANGERVPIWVGNFVLADYGSGMVMGVPAHDKRDFEFAKKYGIEVRQVVAPFFLTREGPDAVREDKETVRRNTVLGIVKHWENDEYYCLDWEKFGWKSLVIGGVDEGERDEDAIAREVKEETGYQDIKNIKLIGTETHSSFFAGHKDINRYGRYKTFLVELGSDEWIQPEEEHVKNHNGEWVKGGNVGSYLNLKNNNYVWDEFVNGETAYVDEGVLINSGKFDKMDNVEAKVKITDWLATRGIGKRVVNFKLRDWGVSRQRYWGTPIPIVYCGKCGVVAVPEKDLPIELPIDVKFGEGNPLESADDWVLTSCPKCGGVARRECDTMDTFVNSSWYFLRYADPKNSEVIFDKEKVKYWNPVDVYVGGAEHACMHLLYARFYVKFLRDIGMLDFDEPFTKLFHQGMLHAEDGRKMSKSYNNVVEPIETIAKYGVDATRWFLISVASPDKDFDWSEKGISGATRFIRRVLEFYNSFKAGRDSDELASRLNLLIRNVSSYYDSFDYRKATIELREFFGEMEKGCSEKTAKTFVKLICPIAPHVAEELWHLKGWSTEGEEFVSVAAWPEFDKKAIISLGGDVDLNAKIVERVKGIMRDDVNKVYVYVMPFELMKVDAKEIGKGVGLEVVVFAVNDSGKVDPKGMAKKAKPGKASVWLE